MRTDELICKNCGLPREQHEVSWLGTVPIWHCFVAEDMHDEGEVFEPASLVLLEPEPSDENGAQDEIERGAGKMEYLMWPRTDGRFRWAPLDHAAICSAIDDMGKGDQGIQAIYGRARISISMMLPSGCNVSMKLREWGLLDKFVNGSLVGERTNPEIRGIVEELVRQGGREARGDDTR